MPHQIATHNSHTVISLVFKHQNEVVIHTNRHPKKGQSGREAYSKHNTNSSTIVHTETHIHKHTGHCPLCLNLTSSNVHNTHKLVILWINKTATLTQLILKSINQSLGQIKSSASHFNINQQANPTMDVSNNVNHHSFNVTTEVNLGFVGQCWYMYCVYVNATITWTNQYYYSTSMKFTYKFSQMKQTLIWNCPKNQSELKNGGKCRRCGRG